MMRGAILLLIALVAVEATPLSGSAYLARWNQFKQKYGKSYATAEEETTRFNIFIENQRYIDQHNEQFNAGKSTYKLGMNKFSDLTNQEFRTRNGARAPPKAEPAPIYQANAKDPLPDSVDWRTQGYVTEVKDQGGCGSCWAFSSTGALEGQHKNKTGDLVSLSEQNLVDCAKLDFGCGGGWMDRAFMYVKRNDGIDTEESYPYTAKDGKCKYDASDVGATDTGYIDIKTGDEDDLTSAVANVGPIAVAIDASGPNFQSYESGVYYNPQCKSDKGDLDHGVLVVGYGATDDGTKYYIVKNSWGADWGDQGYLLMSRDKDNNCGIATAASYPTV